MSGLLIAIGFFLFPLALLFTYFVLTKLVELVAKKSENIAYWALPILFAGAALLSIALERFLFKWPMFLA